MHQLEKSDVIGRRIVEIIVSKPNIPVSMSGQSYSEGFLRLDTGHLIDLGDSELPLIACDESEVRNLKRDRKTEREFRRAINRTIVEMTMPTDEDDECVMRITTSNGFVIRFSLGLFWIRPIIRRIDKPANTAAGQGDALAPRRPWWKFW